MTNRGSFKNGHASLLSPEVQKRVTENILNYWSGRKRGPLTEEHRGKLREALKGKTRPASVVKKIRECLPTGKDHWNWRGGTTSLREKIWGSIQYKEWRRKIFTRDRFTCRICGQKSGVLNADHYPKSMREVIRVNSLKTVADARSCKVLWDTRNGRTLCLSCHRKTPTWGKG